MSKAKQSEPDKAEALFSALEALEDAADAYTSCSDNDTSRTLRAAAVAYAKTAEEL